MQNNHEIATKTYILPAAWASYLIYDDDSSLQAEEIKQIKSFIAPLRSAGWYCVGTTSSATWFSWHSDASTQVGTEVAEYLFHKYN